MKLGTRSTGGAQEGSLIGLSVIAYPLRSLGPFVLFFLYYYVLSTFKQTVVWNRSKVWPVCVVCVCVCADLRMLELTCWQGGKWTRWTRYFQGRGMNNELLRSPLWTNNNEQHERGKSHVLVTVNGIRIGGQTMYIDLDEFSVLSSLSWTIVGCDC